LSNQIYSITNTDTKETISLDGQISFNVDGECIKISGISLYKIIKDLMDTTTPIAIIPTH
jgi:hypothetical protein